MITWASRSRYFFFADIYEAVVCVHLPTSRCNKKNIFYIIAISTSINGKNANFHSSLFVELQMIMHSWPPKLTATQNKIYSLCKCAAILHTCYVCFAVLFKCVMLILVELWFGVRISALLALLLAHLCVRSSESENVRFDEVIDIFILEKISSWWTIFLVLRKCTSMFMLF